MTHQGAAEKATLPVIAEPRLVSVAPDQPVAARPDAATWRRLVAAAWRVEQRAVARNTPVGSAVLSSSGRIHTGCNVEHKLRCHDVHAEVNALSSMIAAGDRDAVALLVVSAGRRLTPCGGCLDWIFELGGPSCLVAWQGDPKAPLRPVCASELMPMYPY